jgi:chromosome segregation ATPase
MSNDNNVIALNKKLQFSSYDIGEIQSCGDKLNQLRTEITSLYERASVYENLQQQASSIIAACVLSRSRSRALAETLKTENAMVVDNFKLILKNAESTPAQRAELLDELAADYDDRIQEIRGAYAQALTVLAPARKSLPAAQLKSEHARLSSKSKDDKNLIAQKALIEKCKADLAKLEDAKAQLDKKALGDASSRPGKDAAGKPLKDLVPADALQIVGTLYDGVANILVLADLLKAINGLREKLADLQSELSKLEKELQSFGLQLELLVALQAVEVPRKAFEQAMEIVLEGVSKFIDASEAPEADPAVRVANFAANALSLDAYLAPVAHG